MMTGLFFSDVDSFSESSSSEDQDDTEFMYSGQAKSVLSSLEEAIGKIDNFLLFERSFIRGDIVRSVTGPEGPLGKITNVDMTVDLENIHGKKMRGVSSNKLQKIRSMSVGDYVISGSWVGKVEKLCDCVTVLFDDGTKCEFMKTGLKNLVPVFPDLFDDPQFPFYPGQRVRVEVSSMSKPTRWLCGAEEGKQDKGTVCSVDADMAYVDWLGCAIEGSEMVPAPPSLQKCKDLNMVSYFSRSNWQLGDGCVLSVPTQEGAMGNFFLKQAGNRFQPTYTSPKFYEIFVIAKTKTKVDVLWQDGSESFGLDSHSVFPVNIIDAHEFWPGQFVMEKATSEDSKTQRWGVVRYVDAKERTVRIQWESSAFKEENDLKGEKMEETVSAYELVEHPDYAYSYGDVVVKLKKCRSSSDVSDKEHKSEKDCARNSHEFCSNPHLSNIGSVVGIKDGMVEVIWATGFTTKVAPCKILRLDKSDDVSAMSLLHYENSTPVAEHNNQSFGPKEKDLLEMDGDGKDCLKGLRDSKYLNLPRAAIGFFTSIAASVFGSLGYSSFLVPSDNLSHGKLLSEIHDEEVVTCSLGELPSIRVDFQSSVEKSLEKNFIELIETKEFMISSVEKGFQKIRRFEMVTDCSDHHFFDGAVKDSSSSQVKKSWLKKVHQEWSTLEEDLPETMYVRVYDERMDLLRAAIVGAPGTPYHDILFLFDILLPPEYPHEPPMVHYHSGGLRVNPNLYESGKVCLSLLNTWTGTGSEAWDPSMSTVLQVLLSLQALVLNEKPFFNEAGYDKEVGRAEGEKNSVSYNENAFLDSCKSMLYLLRKPPKEFEEIVEDHVRERGGTLLAACKAYLEGVPVGRAFASPSPEEDVRGGGSSTGFKIMLAKLLPKVVEAFSEKGVDCSEYA